jgi:hypothetical protein
LMANHAVSGGIGVQGDPDLSVRRFVDEAEFTLCVEGWGRHGVYTDAVPAAT